MTTKSFSHELLLLSTIFPVAEMGHSIYPCDISSSCHSSPLRSFWVLILLSDLFFVLFLCSTTSYYYGPARAPYVFFWTLGMYWSEQGRRQSPTAAAKALHRLTWFHLYEYSVAIVQPDGKPRCALMATIMSSGVMRDPVLCLRRQRDIREDPIGPGSNPSSTGLGPVT